MTRIFHIELSSLEEECAKHLHNLSSLRRGSDISVSSGKGELAVGEREELAKFISKASVLMSEAQ